MTIFRYVVEFIIFIMWIAGLLIRIVYQKEYREPVGKDELRQPRMMWPIGIAGLTVALFVVLIGKNTDPIIGVAMILITAFFMACAFNGVNWRICYTDTEFIYRSTFRTLRKYRFEEIVSVQYLGEVGKNAGREDQGFKLVMPDCKIHVYSSQNPGDFLKKALRKQKKYI